MAASLQGNHVVLVHKLPDVIDEWTLKKLPVGKYMSAVEINPTDRSKAMIWTRTREDGQVIVDNLNGLLIEGKTLAACFLSPRNGYIEKKGSGSKLLQRDNYRKRLPVLPDDWPQGGYKKRSSKISRSASCTKVATQALIPKYQVFPVFPSISQYYKRKIAQATTKPKEYVELLTLE